MGDARRAVELIELGHDVEVEAMDDLDASLEKYDAIVIALPAPSSAFVNRYFTRRFYQEARAALAELHVGLGIQQAIGNRWEQVNILNGLGVQHLELGDFAAAQAFLQQGLQLAREIGDVAGQAYLLIDLDGTEDEIKAQSHHILGICRDMGVLDIRVVKDEKEAESYWTARSNLGGMLLTMMKKAINEDVAVPRNRIKRLIRESFRQHQEMLAGWDLVVLVRPGAAGRSNQQLFSALENHWRTIAQHAHTDPVSH